METMTETEELPTIQTLTAAHRCDAECPARAAVQCFDSKDQELLFCGHHYAKYETGIATWAVAVNDERHFNIKQQTPEHA